MKLGVIGAALATLILAACATPHYAPAPPVHHRPSPFPSEPRPPVPAPSIGETLPLADLPGWSRDDHAEAFAAFTATCAASKDPAFREICRSARAMGPLGPSDARRFFEANFRALQSPPPGVLTAYFAPEYEARKAPDGEFSAPVRPKPSDLRQVDAGLFDSTQAGRLGAARDPGDGPLQPYPDRTAIEATPATGAIAWMRPEDLFFLQIQGSGVLTFEDGRRMKVLYAANNGRPFVPIAGVMRQRGLLAANSTSGDGIRAWLAAHRGPEAQEIMQLNPRYAFFTLAPDDGRQPVGAAGLPLPPGRGIAVDPLHHQMGELVWLDAEAPVLKDAFPTYRRLAMTLDTGGAIKGEVRADLYIGLGPMAGAEAGRVRHTLRMYRLIPRGDLAGSD